MSPASNKIVATVLGAVGIALWASETVLVNFTTRIPPLETVAIAFFFAAALSPVIALATGESLLVAFRQPARVWLLTISSLVGYHACIYYATQKAPPAAAALLQGTTPLMIVLGSALLPGERLRWWHLAGAALGFAGILCLIDTGSGQAATSGSKVFFLALIGIAAGLWGLYSLATRLLPEVPSSALGTFYAASCVVSLLLHMATETWVRPNVGEWMAIAGLGCLPMGLAIFFWDLGMKRGDVQALGAFSYVEPFIGALLVAAFAHGAITGSVLQAGFLVTAGAFVASLGLWRNPQAHHAIRLSRHRIDAAIHDLASVSDLEQLASATHRLVALLAALDADPRSPRHKQSERDKLLNALGIADEVFNRACQFTPTASQSFRNVLHAVDAFASQGPVIRLRAIKNAA